MMIPNISIEIKNLNKILNIKVKTSFFNTIIFCIITFPHSNGGKMCFLLFLAIIFLLSWSMTSAQYEKLSFCNFLQDKYICQDLPEHLKDKINFPLTSCTIRSCNTCLISLKTFILTEEFQLLEPISLLLTSANTSSNTSTFYTCSSKTGDPCECGAHSSCTGPEIFCKFQECTTNASCICNLTKRKAQFIYKQDEMVIINPSLITFPICFHDKRSRKQSVKQTRKLLEAEEAVFTEHNLTIRFHDPILYLPDQGRVILRNEDFEHILKVPDDNIIVLPFEILAYKTSILVIYLHPKGYTVTGVIHVTGKSICTLRQCFFCWEAYTQFKCLPKFMQYFIYFLMTSFVIILVCCLKIILKSIIFLLHYIYLFFYMCYRFFKFMARFSLLLGAYIGSAFRQTLARTHDFLENHAGQGIQFNQIKPVLIALCMLITLANSDCGNHAIVQSEVKTCETISDGTKVCQVFTTAEFSLKALSAETCLWFTDKRDNHLFSLKIKLDAVTCHFQTSREYYTFPVAAKHLSQISCIFNEYCGRGVHCQKSKLGKEGLGFEGETPESLQFPGLSSCQAGGLGVGCTILTRAACNFYRTWYVPNLLESYEVSKITGHKCQYHISISHSENNTVSQLTLKDVAYTKTGIKVKILGAYDQPSLHISDYFVKRVGRPSESYLTPACPRNQPKVGQVGQIQSNISYSNNFIFDPALSQCDFFEDILRCTSPPNVLDTLRLSKEYALPREHHLHLFHAKNGKLTSTLLVSSAVRVQLYFSHFKIAVQAITVCPHFDDSSIETMGCYNCPLFARMILKAHSTCQSGTVTVQFQDLTVYTKALQLETDPSPHIIKFLAEKKCYQEKLCLRAMTLVQCQTVDFCLQEPSVELFELDTNYTKTTSAATTSNWFDWLQILKMDTSLVLLKLIGSSLFIICLAITLISTILTCCCRTR